MKPIKAMKCYISKQLSPLHLLFTEEDNVVVVRCLDFSISSHGETETEALEAINSSLLDYIEYGLENGDIDNLFDPDVKEYWELYREMGKHSGKFIKGPQSFPVKTHGKKTEILPYALTGLIKKFNLPKDVFD